MADVTSSMPLALHGALAVRRSGKPSPPPLVRNPSSVRFVEPAVTPPATAARRPAFVHRDTAESSKSIDALLANTYPPPAPSPASAPRAGATQHKAHIFGIPTAYKPLWLLGMGSAGNVLYSLGATAVERGIWRQKPPFGAPPGTPYRYRPLFNHREASLGLGTTALVVGTGMALTSSVLLLQDARRLARRQNPSTPAYTRSTMYFAAHASGIFLSVSGKFMQDVLRDVLPDDVTWAAATPGFVGQALFAVTQAQAFSNCELLNGKLRLKHRGMLGATARFGVGTFTLWAAMMSVPGFSPYVREVTRLFAQTCTAVAYSLPLTTARLGRQQGVDFTSHEPENSWRPLSVLAAYIVGRCMAGFGPDLIQKGVFNRQGDYNEPALISSIYGGTSLLTAGTAVCITALMLFREDVTRYNAKRGNLLVGVTIFALMCILAYSGITQYGHTVRRQQLLWLGVVPGIIGAGLRLVTLPEFFSYAELLHGHSKIPYRYQWTEACRAGGNLCFSIWGVMGSVPTTNSFAKETLGVLAAALVTLGMALPTTTSRKALPKYAWPLSPGLTPAGIVEGSAFPFLEVAQPSDSQA